MTTLLPDAALSQHVIVLGKTRSGKSSTMRLMVERLLDQGKPVCIIDPKGDWWGLKSSADGKQAGYPVIIFGGEHADVPLNAHSGAHVAELIATGNRPCIIDLGGWMPGERTRFFVDFASTLFRHTKGLRWLVIDECHNFAPQGKVLDPDSGKMLHWANRLANEGSGKGLTLISASQRPQKVHKDYVTAHETLVAKRVIHKLDRDAVEDWMNGHGDRDKSREIVGTLAEMTREEGWVWSPEIQLGPTRVHFPMFSTYDSFKPSTGEHVTKLKGWASVDLDEIRVKLSAVVEEAKANDPKALKAEIAKLKREMASAVKTEPAPDQKALTAAERKSFDAGRQEGIGEGEKRDYARGFKEALKAAGEALRGVETPADVPVSPLPAMKRSPPVVAPRPVTWKREPVAAPTNGTGLPGPQRRILNSLATWMTMGHARPLNAQAAWLAGYSPSSTSYTNPRSALRTIGLIEYPEPDRLALTPEGERYAVAQDIDDLAQFVLNHLAGPERRILAAALALNGEPGSNEEIASAANYSAGSASYTNPRSALRTKGLINYPSPNMVQAADWLAAA